MATWTVPVKEIKKFLPKKLKPVLSSLGMTYISFGTLEYANVSSIKSYDEFLISIPVQYNPKINLPFLSWIWNPFFPHERIYKKGAAYIIQLPVTTKEAHEVGVEVWGFPKVIRNMEFRENKDFKICRLIYGKEEVLTLEIKKYPVSKNRKDFQYGSYTEKDGKLLRTIINATGRYNIKMFGEAKLSFGKGKIADEMRRLNLSKNPIQVFLGENIESDLPLAQEIFKK